MPEYPPTMHLDGKHARAMKGKAPGSTVRMIVHGTVASQSVNKDPFGRGKRHSTSIEISRVRPMSAGKPRGK
jgi:hypothetical protein